MNEHTPQPTNEQPGMAKFSAKDVFLDTVQEIQSYGTLEKNDVNAFANELGVEDDYSKWHSTVPGLKVLDREKLQSEIDSRGSDPTAEDAEKIQHDQRQAEYDELFAGKSDEDVDNEISRYSHEKKVFEHNKSYRLENEARGERNALRDTDSTELQKKTITELAGLLKEKPDFKTSKSDYIKRIKGIQDGLKASSAEPLDLITPQINTNESTAQTIDAIVKFNKNLLKAQLEKPITPAEQEENPHANAINLAEQYLKVSEKDKAAFLKEHADEYLSQFIALVNDIKANKIPLSGLNPHELEGIMQPLNDYLVNQYEGVNGERFNEEEVRSFLGNIYKQNVTPILERELLATASPEVTTTPLTAEELKAASLLGLSGDFAKFTTRDERIAFLDANREGIHDLVRDMMHTIDKGEVPFADMPDAEAKQIFKMVVGYLKRNHGADKESLINFWYRLNGTKPAEATTSPEAAKNQAVNTTAVSVGQTATGRIWSPSKDPIWNTSFAKLKTSYREGQQVKDTGRVGKAANWAGRTKVAGKINNVYQNVKARRGNASPVAGASFAVAGVGAMSQAEARGMAQRADVQKPSNGAQDQGSDPSLKVVAHGRRS